MKRIITIVALLVMFVSMDARAQFSLNLQAGWNQNMASGFSNNHYVGLCNSVDVMYTPQFCGGKLSFGVSQNGVFFWATDPDFVYTEPTPDVSKFFLTGAKLRYDFSDARVHPYISVLAGMADVRSNSVLDIAAYEAGNFSFVGNCVFSTEKRYFGINPEVGVSVGKMYFGLGYMLPKKWEERGVSYKYSHLQLIVGVRLGK